MSINQIVEIYPAGATNPNVGVETGVAVNLFDMTKAVGKSGVHSEWAIVAVRPANAFIGPLALAGSHGSIASTTLLPALRQGLDRAEFDVKLYTVTGELGKEESAEKIITIYVRQRKHAGGGDGDKSSGNDSDKGVDSVDNVDMITVLTVDGKHVFVDSNDFARLLTWRPELFSLVVPGVPTSGWKVSVTESRLLELLSQTGPPSTDEHEPPSTDEPSSTKFNSKLIFTDLGYDTAIGFWSSSNTSIEFTLRFWSDGQLLADMKMIAEPHKPIKKMVCGDLGIRADLMEYEDVDGLSVVVIGFSPKQELFVI